MGKLLFFWLAAISFFLAGCNFQIKTSAISTNIQWHWFGAMFLTIALWIA